MTRIVVAGSRGFEDYQYLCEKLDELTAELDGDIEIVSGGAKGADTLGARYAADRGLSLAIFKPDWKRYGKGAGMIRNQQMLNYASEQKPLVAAFWDGESKGTKDTIRRANLDSIDTKVYLYKKAEQTE